jgi:hypothetical protein
MLAFSDNDWLGVDAGKAPLWAGSGEFGRQRDLI